MSDPARRDDGSEYSAPGESVAGHPFMPAEGGPVDPGIPPYDSMPTDEPTGHAAVEIGKALAYQAGTRAFGWATLTLIAALGVQFYRAAALDGAWETPFPFTLSAEILQAFGARPNAALEPSRVIASAFIHDDLFWLILAAIFMISPGRQAEGRYGATGLLLAFVGSSAAGSYFQWLWGPVSAVDAGCYPGLFGLIGLRVAYGLRFRRSLPSGLFGASIREAVVSIFLLGLFSAIKSSAAQSIHLPWNFIGGGAGGLVLGFLLPARYPEGVSVGVATRRAVGFLAGLVVMGVLVELPMGNAAPREDRPPAEAIGMKEARLSRLGVAVGVDPSWSRRNHGDASAVYEGDFFQLFVFSQPRGSFQGLSAESLRQIRVFRESSPDVTMTVEDQREMSLLGRDGVEKEAALTSVIVEPDRGARYYQLWYALRSKERFVFLIYRIPAKDAHSLALVEASLEFFRFLDEE